MSRYVKLFGFLLMLLSCMATYCDAQPNYKVSSYSKLNNSVSSIRRIVRDGNGLMWFATNDGLYRYDGYEFKNFKSHSGDGVDMPSNHINNMYTSSEGFIWCLVSDRAFIFDTRLYKYVDVLKDFEQQQGQKYSIRRIRALPCGTTWLFTDDGAILALQDAHPTQGIRLIANHEQIDHVTVVCDDQQRSWVLTGQHTYLYYNEQLRVFNQVFIKIINSPQGVWLLKEDGSIYAFDEAVQQVKPWKHPLLNAPIKGFSNLTDGRLALFTDAGLLLMSANGKEIASTNITDLVSKIMEDKNGHLWILTEAGRLSMADRECLHPVEIEGFRAKKCNMMSDKHGNLWFITEHGETFYAMVDTPTKFVRNDHGTLSDDIHNSIDDGQGGFWFIHKQHAYRLSFESAPFRQLPLQQPGAVRCAVFDAQNRLLIATADDEAVTVFSHDGQRLGWLKRDGTISNSYATFGARIYSGYLDDNGTLWLGSKKDGVFRLRSQDDGFRIDQYVKDERSPHQSLSDNEVYAFAADKKGRLWIATHKGGPCCIVDKTAEQPQFVYAENGLVGWKFRLNAGVNSLLVTPDEMLFVGTFNGLFVADVSTNNLKDITFQAHQRESTRKESLSTSMVNGILHTSDGRYFVSTSDGGINEVLTKNLLAQQLDFRHYDMSTGFPVDITGNMIEYDGALWTAAPNQLVELQLQKSDQPSFNSFLLHDNPRFSSCAPVHIEGGKWVFGSENGALLIDLNQLKSNSFIPPLVITGVSKENHPTDYAEGWNDVITLAPDERSLTLFFSALDYENTELVAYAYRMGGDENNWTYLGQNHSITLAQMHPGTYQLTIRSTNNDGVWCNNERTLTIIVQPTFWETPWAKLLIVAVIAVIALIVVSTILYIRRIKRQQREMLEAYLASLAEKESRPSPAEAHAHSSLSEEDDRLMQQLMAFIEQNLGNSDITIDDMAKFVAVSRTSLHRKVKNLIGTTPMEFLREARIRKASQMLMQTSASVSQVAYECGFSDPKYFSKCFKAATGQTPTEYKASV